MNCPHIPPNVGINIEYCIIMEYGEVKTMRKTLKYQLVILLAVTPILIGMVGILPNWIYEAQSETVYRQMILMTIFSGIGLVMTMYLYCLYQCYQACQSLELPKTRTIQRELSRVIKASLIMGVLLMIELPFVYVFADETDAPGIILVFAFYMVLSFAISYLFNRIKIYQLESRFVDEIPNRIRTP